MARILAIDYGLKRTGIAVTDELQIIASGLTTVATEDIIEFLKQYVKEEPVELFLIGEPKRLNNEASEIEKFIEIFLKKLTVTFSTIPIKRIDERFTSKIAFNVMKESGIGRKKRRDKALIDKISATIILQDYLNSK